MISSPHISGLTKSFSITTTASQIAEANGARIKFLILAAAGNSDTVFIGLDDSGVASSGAHTGIRLAAGDQAVEEVPPIFKGRIWAISNSGTQTLTFYETEGGNY